MKNVKKMENKKGFLWMEERGMGRRTKEGWIEEGMHQKKKEGKKRE